MASKVKAVPDGYSTVTPYLVVRGAAQAIEFYKKALGAVERFRMPGAGGALMHAEIQIGDSLVMLCDEFPEMGSKSPQALGGTPISVFLYVEDVDSWFKRAIDSGANVQMPPTDMFWGDRFCKLLDPFGHEWAIATHKEDVAPEELAKRATKAMSQAAG